MSGYVLIDPLSNAFVSIKLSTNGDIETSKLVFFFLKAVTFGFFFLFNWSNFIYKHGMKWKFPKMLKSMDKGKYK